MISKNEESSWQKASASLDATAKIYGFRVDSVHSETYKFLGGLNRNKKDSNLKNNDEMQDELDETKKKEKIKRGVNTLETNIKKLNLSKYDIESEVDPLFSIMTSKFNESSAKGLLLNTIPLNENLNYILESKKEDDEIPTEKSSKEKIKNKQEDNHNDTESISNDLSEASGSKKISEALVLANNLKNNEKPDNNKGDNNNNMISVVCSKDFENVSDDIIKVLKSFIKDINIDDFVKLQICPDLTIFRQSRQLFNGGDLNTTFINTFKEELNLADKNLPHENFDENNNSIIDEEAQDNLPMDGEEVYDEMPERMSQNSNNDFNSVENNESNQNESSSSSFPAFNLKNSDSTFAVFRYEDLIERAGHFGTGITQNLPEFMIFAKNFGKLEKNTIFNKGSILGLNKKKEGERKKKEEKTFVFNEKNEVNINDLFSEFKSKALNKANDFGKYNKKKRKTKIFFHFDKFSQFKLFTIPNKTISSRDIDDDLNMEKHEQNLLNMNNQDNDIFDGGDTDNQNDNDIIGFEKNNEYESFYENEKKVEKNFGKLYRKFDIRALKKKIWTSYEDIKEYKVDFKNVVINMSTNMGEEELFSISTPTCFVCMLHLCNEKNLFIEQTDMNTFYIEKDSSGKKSEKSIEKKNNKSSDSDEDDSDTKELDIDK